MMTGEWQGKGLGKAVVLCEMKPGISTWDLGLNDSSDDVKSWDEGWGHRLKIG